MSREKEFSALKQSVDVSQIFLVFMATIGDVEKTALAVERDPEFIAWLAEQEGWSEKVRKVSLMSKGGKPGDWERAQNRCLNFVQAHRVRMLIDRVLLELVKLPADKLEERFKSCDRHGKPNGVSARFFSDITAAMDKVHSLSYYALGDSVGERIKRVDDEGGDRSVGDIHAALIQALNCPNVRHETAEALVLEASAAVSAEQPERKALGDGAAKDPG